MSALQDLRYWRIYTYEIKLMNHLNEIFKKHRVHPSEHGKLIHAIDACYQAIIEKLKAEDVLLESNVKKIEKTND